VTFASRAQRGGEGQRRCIGAGVRRDPLRRFPDSTLGDRTQDVDLPAMPLLLRCGTRGRRETSATPAERGRLTVVERLK